MSKKMRRQPSKAKRLVMQPQFRRFTEKPAKGKGSYNRKVSPSNRYDEAFVTYP